MFRLKSGDALHLATALRLGTDAVEIVTHDAQMARAARSLGFAVSDPITDDPGRPPVAAPRDGDERAKRRAFSAGIFAFEIRGLGEDWTVLWEVCDGDDIAYVRFVGETASI